jgi:hypothetical protein
MSQPRIDIELETGTGRILGSILAKLLAVRRDRRRARRLVQGLPDYSRDVAVPDAERIFAWIEELCATPHRRPASRHGRRAEEWVAATFRRLGLADVTLDPIPVTEWTAERWSLEVEGERTPSFFVVNTGFTSGQGVTAPLAYVGVGRRRDFARIDAEDKILVADVPFPYLPTGALMKLFAAYHLSDPDRSISLRSGQRLNFVRRNFMGGDDAETAPETDVYWQAVRRGARGVCLILRDQPGNSNTHYGPYDGVPKPIPAVWIGSRDGERLRHQARQGRTATLILEGRQAPGMMRNVWGVLPGTSDAVILVTSHHDSPFQGAVEDGAGIAQVLAQAWAWSRVPREERPKTLVFVAAAGHFHGAAGGFAFAQQHRDIMDRARVLITLEHLGAKQVRGNHPGYTETGKLAFTVMFTTPRPEIIATVMKALDSRKPRNTACIPADLLAPVPVSDAIGYAYETQVPVISWIGCPYYLLDEFDTLDKIDRSELVPVAKTVTEIVKTFMASH